MSMQTIQRLLNAHLSTLAGLPTVQHENTQNIGHAGTSFSRATLIPARPSVLTVGVDGRTELRGLYQIDLFVPMNSGAEAVNALADQVIEHFHRGLRITEGAVTVHVSLSWREAGMRVEQFYQVPVVVQWSSVV